MTTLKLTPREREILQELATGATDREIAQRFDLSVATVRTHVRSIRHTLGVNNRTEAIIAAMRLGLIESPENSTHDADRDSTGDPDAAALASPASRKRRLRRRLLRWLPILIVIGILGMPIYRLAPYVWTFAFGPALIHDYHLEYAADENILTHDNGWCSAWPLAVEQEIYGYKLYFSGNIVVEDFEQSPHYLYYRGKWVGPLTARLQGYDSSTDRWIYETSRWFKDLFPRSQDFISWRYDYLCPADS